MVKIDSSLGSLIPYAKFQTYDGAAKFDTNATHMEVDELEIGVEWQIRPEIELTTAYAHMERTNVTSAPYEVIGHPAPNSRDTDLPTACRFGGMCS